jgi:hypothetical protein
MCKMLRQHGGNATSKQARIDTPSNGWIQWKFNQHWRTNHRFHIAFAKRSTLLVDEHNAVWFYGKVCSLA